MAGYHASLKFDAVMVLDSVPPQEDPQTGVWLRDTILQPLADSHGFIIGYSKIANKAELFSALSQIERLVLEGGHYPILHFETHGVPDGVQLADSSLVPWELLRGPLTAINRACRMNLLVMMSMCDGAHLISQLQPVDVSPVWGLIGSVDEKYPCRLQEAFQAFYPELFSSLDGRAAIEAMNARHADGSWDLTLNMAEIWFCKIWQHYEQQYCSAEKLQEREDHIVTTGMRQSGYDLRSAIYGRPYVKEILADNERLFNEYRRSFLMLDSFPENEARFPLTYQDCVKATQQQQPDGPSGAEAPVLPGVLRHG